jgi:hypothetical protein
MFRLVELRLTQDTLPFQKKTFNVSKFSSFKNIGSIIPLQNGWNLSHKPTKAKQFLRKRSGSRDASIICPKLLHSGSDRTPVWSIFLNAVGEVLEPDFRAANISEIVKGRAVSPVPRPDFVAICSYYTFRTIPLSDCSTAREKTLSSIILKVLKHIDGLNRPSVVNNYHIFQCETHGTLI